MWEAIFGRSVYMRVHGSFDLELCVWLARESSLLLDLHYSNPQSGVSHGLTTKREIPRSKSIGGLILIDPTGSS